MTLTVNPEMEKFIESQVKAGNFKSPSEVLEAGLARLMVDPEPEALYEQDIIDIRASMEQAKRGELIDSEVVHAEMRRKYLDK